MFNKINSWLTQLGFFLIRRSMRLDADYLWSWHCSLAMSALDCQRRSAGAHQRANHGAARFLSMCFNVDSTKTEYWKDLELAWSKK